MFRLKSDVTFNLLQNSHEAMGGHIKLMYYYVLHFMNKGISICLFVCMFAINQILRVVVFWYAHVLYVWGFSPSTSNENVL